MRNKTKKNYTKLRQKENKNKHMGCKIKNEEGEFAISFSFSIF
jgi:hypothetical protein